MSLDRLMVRIYTDRKDYKYDQAWVPTKGGYRRDMKLWEVVCVSGEPRKLGIFKSPEECEAFIDSRVNPVEVLPRIYSDICRCGVYDDNGTAKVWLYHKVGELVFEVCPFCGMPMRHDVMTELNRPLIEDFDLEAFLGL